MKSNRSKILLAALIVGIPAVTTLIKSQQSNAILRPATNSVKNMASMINKTALTKPTVAPKPSGVKMANKNLISNRVSIFNNTNNQTKTTCTVKRNQSVGKLDLNTNFASNLNSLLGINNNNKVGFKKSESVSVNKLDSSKQNKLSGLLGSSSQFKSSSLDLSKLPKTPPPPPTQGQGTSQQTSSSQLTTTTTTPSVVPDAPPLPPMSTNTSTSFTGGSLKNQLSNKLDSGLKKTETSKPTLKPTTPQDNMLSELKLKLQSRPKS